MNLTFNLRDAAAPLIGERRFDMDMPLLVGAVALPLLRQLRADLRPAQYNGASFLGLQGIVVKSHGSAGAEGFRSAILRAAEDVRHNLPEQLHSRLEHLLVTNRSVNDAGDVTAAGGQPSN